MSDSPSTISHLREEYNEKRNLFSAQPAILQRFLEAQASVLANALADNLPRVHFTLPDKIIAELPQIDQPAAIKIPTDAREQIIGGLKNRLLKQTIREELRHRLNVLEQSPDNAIAAGASLIRYATATHLIYNMLPSGRSVVYRAEESGEIPCIPADDENLESAITQASDAIAEEGKAENGRGDLQVPFVPAARKFYLPQWVAFDTNGKLLVGSTKEAQAHVASMQRYLEILHNASSVAPYIITDEEYQKKRYGILGQLVNQGRALAIYMTDDIIRTIKERASAGSLNRGLSLSLPYFDDQELKMDMYRFEVIPSGRIMFVAAFVVRAVHAEEAKVAQDTRYNASTRRHLMNELKALEDAFH